MLKQELPRFFHLKAQFIEPVFENFYSMQCKIYGMIYARCYELINANTQHFITPEMTVQDGFEWRRQQRDMRAEVENLDLLKSGGKAWLSASGGSNNSKLSLKERAALRQQEKGEGEPVQFYGSDPSGVNALPPPAYGAGAGTTHLDSTPMGYGSSKQQQDDPYYNNQTPSSPATNNNTYHQRSTSRSGPAPPPPPPIANKSTKYVVALYDYDAQAEGDLSFRKDDKIELVERTADANDWWTGRLNGVTGIFPGKFYNAWYIYDRINQN